MERKKPVNLQLTTIRFPFPAIASILHRISGFVLFLFIPLLLWALDTSLSTPENFSKVQECFSHPVSQFIAWALIAALLYHLVMGVRHLLMDAGIGESKAGGRRGAVIAFIVAIVVILIAGVMIW